MSLENNNSNFIQKYKNELIKDYIKKRGSQKSILNFVHSESRKRYPLKVNPKLKLPSLPKASVDSTFSHEIWNTEVKFNEVKEDIRLLKKKLFEEPLYEAEHVEDTIENEEETAKIGSALNDIISLEDKLEESYLELENEKKLRRKQQRDICKEIQSLDTCPFEQRSTQNFHKLCNYKPKDDTNTKKLVPINKPKFVINRRKSIKNRQQKSRDKSKNTQLSKNRKMDSVILTEEEKTRIAMLTADIEDDPENDLPTKDIGSIDILHNAFTLEDHERNQIHELEDKLTQFPDTSEKRNLKKEEDSMKFGQINWKEIKEVSMREIDKALDAIHEAETDTNDIKTK